MFSGIRNQGIKGFTLVEVMITTVIVAISVGLALPSWNTMIEKRQLVSAAEEIASFIRFAQSEAVKSNDTVTVSWNTPGGHSSNFCMGISAPPKTAPCDCYEEVETAADFCSVDSVPHRMTKTDFVDINNEFMHMRPQVGDFGFDPIRGTVVNESDAAEFYDGDYLFKVHSNHDESSPRLFALQFEMTPTGRFSICTETSRQMRVGAYQSC